MKLSSFVIAVVTLCASPATAQTIAIHPGEALVVRFDHGAAVVEQRGPAAPITRYEVYALWRAETQDVPAGAKVVPPGFLEEGEGPPNPPHPSGDTLQITMRRVPGVKQGSADNTALFLSNGYASGVRYLALMRSGERFAPTDVCDLAPHLLGLEHWPYEIDELDLSDLRLIGWSGSIQCG